MLIVKCTCTSVHFYKFIFRQLCLIMVRRTENFERLAKGFRWKIRQQSTVISRYLPSRQPITSLTLALNINQKKSGKSKCISEGHGGAGLACGPASAHCIHSSFCATTGKNSEKKTHLHLPPIFNPPFPLTETLVRQVLTWAFPSHCNPFLLNFKTNTFGKCWVCTFPLKTHKV